MERELYSKLLEWKNSKNRKPLIIRGVRQCGKTYLMKQFGELEYTDVAYFKFEGNTSLCKIFDGDLYPERLLKALSLHLNMDITPDTLIIFDEIQECERAMTSLKSFNESSPKYHIICAGSLPGLHGKGSFPVGKVSFLNLYPMNFREFVKATNIRLFDHIEESGIDEISMNMLEPLLKDYLVVGGMPEVVSKWLESKSINEVDRILNEISESYRLDFMKHAPANDIKKINMIWESIPSQLATENRRFFFGHAVKGSRSKDLEDALQWLIDAHLIYKVPRVEHIGIPLSSHSNDKMFKIYMMDVGILRHMSNVMASHMMEGIVDPLFYGGFIENYVMCELSSYGRPGEGYWVSGNSAEVDFLLTTEKGIVPVEVKSGNRYRAASLKEYIDRYGPELAILISGKMPGENDKVTTISLCAIWALEKVLSENV